MRGLGPIDRADAPEALPPAPSPMGGGSAAQQGHCCVPNLHGEYALSCEGRPVRLFAAEPARTLALSRWRWPPQRSIRTAVHFWRNVMLRREFLAGSVGLVAAAATRPAFAAFTPSRPVEFVVH